MPLTSNNDYYDFEELFFEKGCNIDEIIMSFFTKYKDVIKGDIKYITYKIKETIYADRKFLIEINRDGKDILNTIGKTSFIKHHVIPIENNGKEFYIYAINSFI